MLEEGKCWGSCNSKESIEDDLEVVLLAQRIRPISSIHSLYMIPISLNEESVLIGIRHVA